MIDIVLPAMPGQGDEGKVRGDGAIVGSCSSSVIGKRPWEIVRELSRPHEHLSTLVWAIKGLRLFSLCLGLSFCVTHTNKVPEGQIPHGVAGGTNLFVNLITSPDGAVIKGVYKSSVTPPQLGSVKGEVSTDLCIQLVGNSPAHTREHTEGGQCGLFTDRQTHRSHGEYYQN